VVLATDPKIQADLDDALPLDQPDKAFTAGWIGLWTKTDFIAEFAPW
jgi:hypothetical protein